MSLQVQAGPVQVAVNSAPFAAWTVAAAETTHPPHDP